MSAQDLAQTVAWTQLAQAMRADGMSVGDKCPPHIAEFIRDVVSAALGERGMTRAWPGVFRTLNPGTRVRAPEACLPFYEAGSEGVILTHSADGCTLVAFDAPLKSEATKTKPADAWWVATHELEVL